VDAAALEELLPELNADRVRARADAVLGEALYWFPVRHHSPAVARHLLSAMRARRPRIVFIEAPSDAEDLVQFVVDGKTKPPVALYCSYRDDDDVLGLAGIVSPAPDVPAKFASWFPLLGYSPEYIAMKEGAAIDASIVFIDLPHHGLVRSRAERGLPPKGEPGAPDDHDTPSSADGETERETARETGEDEAEAPTRAGWDALAAESSLYLSLAETAGYRSWDECWDALFEAPERHDSHDAFRTELAYFCAAVRATTPAARMEHDGTLLREAHMWRAITRTLAETGVDPSDAIVVCGGFHLFMAREELAAARELPAGTVYRTVAPYSYLRTSDLTGYGAGNRAPLYYERLFTHARDAPRDAAIRAMVDHVVAVLARGRRDGELLSSADAISVTQHARMLASLRRHSSVTLDDVRDGLVACCVKGSIDREGRQLVSAMTNVEVGSAIGRVTPTMGRLPLVHDFYRLVDDLELGEMLAKEKRSKLTLDLREPEAERRSILFHRLAQIGVPFAEPLSLGSESTLFREVWAVAWSPKVDASLVEQNLWGDTVEAAALARLDDGLASATSAADVTSRLLDALKMDLPGMVTRLEAVAGTAIDTDTRLPSLGRAITNLSILQQHARRRSLRTDILSELVDRGFARACFALPQAANVPAEEHADVVAAIRSLGELMLGERGAHLDRELLVTSVQAAYADSKSPYLRGALSGVLTELRVQTPGELGAQLSAFARERPEVLVTCGDFLAGMLATSRTALLLGADEVVAAIDELLRTAAWEDFLVLLPKARGAFHDLHDRARVSLADRVAVKYGLRAEEGDTLAKLETTAGAAARIMALDRRTGEIMRDWELE